VAALPHAAQVAAVSVLVLGLRLASVIAESASRFGGDRSQPKTENKATAPDRRSGRFRGNEARSDHDLAVSLEI
jgi:hypothetical protein